MFTPQTDRTCSAERTLYGERESDLGRLAELPHAPTLPYVAAKRLAREIDGFIGAGRVCVGRRRTVCVAEGVRNVVALGREEEDGHRRRQTVSQVSVTVCVHLAQHILANVCVGMIGNLLVVPAGIIVPFSLAIHYAAFLAVLSVIK